MRRNLDQMEIRPNLDYKMVANSSQTHIPYFSSETSASKTYIFRDEISNCSIFMCDTAGSGKASRKRFY